MSDPWELDDRFIYDEITTLGGDTQYVRVGCHHRNRMDVRNIHTDIVVAQLCVDCDTQLPPPKEPW